MLSQEELRKRTKTMHGHMNNDDKRVCRKFLERYVWDGELVGEETICMQVRVSQARTSKKTVKKFCPGLRELAAS